MASSATEGAGIYVSARRHEAAVTPICWRAILDTPTLNNTSIATSCSKSARDRLQRITWLENLEGGIETAQVVCEDS